MAYFLICHYNAVISRRKGKICYVDRFLFSNDSMEKQRLKEGFFVRFRMKDLGQSTHVFGTRIRWESNEIYLDQGEYIEEVSCKFKMLDCECASTPMDAGIKLTKSDKCRSDDQYQCLIGSLMHLSATCRWEISVHSKSFKCVPPYPQLAKTLGLPLWTKLNHPKSDV